LAALSGPSNEAFKKIGAVAETRAAGLKRLDKNPKTNAKQRNWPGEDDQDDQP
jgi:hypothetical protein